MHPGAGVASGVDWGDVIDGRPVARCQEVISRVLRGELRIQVLSYRPRLRAESAQTAYPCHHIVQPLWNPDLRGVADARVDAIPVLMNLRVEGPLRLRHRSGKRNQVARRCHALQREALRLQPTRHLAQICLRQSKARSELLLRQPLVILSRLRILLRLHESIQFCLLGHAGRCDQRHRL